MIHDTDHQLFDRGQVSSVGELTRGGQGPDPSLQFIFLVWHLHIFLLLYASSVITIAVSLVIGIKWWEL